VLEAKQKTLVIAGGRRVGKSQALCQLIAFAALRRPNQKVIYIGPAYPIVQKFYKKFMSPPTMRRLVKHSATQPAPHVLLVNGSEIEFRSFVKPEFIRGDGYHLVCADEAAQLNYEQFQDVVLPLTDVDNGTLVLTGTFKGETNWFTKEFAAGADVDEMRQNLISLTGDDREAANRFIETVEATPKDPKRRCFFWPTPIAPWYQTPRGKELLEYRRSRLPDVTWQQEYLALANANRYAAFSQRHIDACTKADLLPQIDARPGCSYAAGYDIGKAQDPPALVVIESPSGRICLTKPVPLNMDYGPQARQLVKWLLPFGPRNTLCVLDATGEANPAKGRDDVVDTFRNILGEAQIECRAVYQVQAVKRRLYRNLRMGLEKHALQIPKTATRLLSELGTIECKSVNGMEVFQPQEGCHDDLVSAFAMAWEAVKSGWLPTGRPANLSRMLH
jgi:hypothetical protein